MTAIMTIFRSFPTISIHIPRVGDDAFGVLRIDPCDIISIHIPRVGDDACKNDCSAVLNIISIHIPRVGDDYIL